MEVNKDRIKRDLRVCYMNDKKEDKLDLKSFIKSNNKKDYQHLLDCYNITEIELKTILREMFA